MGDAARRVGGGGIGAAREVEREGRFGAEERQARGVAVDRGRAAVLEIKGVDLVDDAVAAVAARGDADLLAGVAAEHRPVLNQRHAQAGTRGGERRAAAAKAAADDHEVKVGRCFRCRRLAAHLRAPLRQGGAAVGGWRGRGIGREEERVAAAVEAGEVAQPDFKRGGGEVDGPAVGPAPRGRRDAEERGQQSAVERDLEAAGLVARAVRRPVARAYPEAPNATARQRDGGHGVGDRRAESVRQQVGRPHGVAELRVQHPAAAVRKGFGLDQQAVGPQRQDGEGECGRHEARARAAAGARAAG
ncbi:MAG: hypothetical protein BWX69_03227 [Planctomycetes bacterium ADurb.Bin069]|nr:MAG: hypothetical protein BWX69_03227 [Planctomycetes bacterium ADurb.Bin069]